MTLPKFPDIFHNFIHRNRYATTIEEWRKQMIVELEKLKPTYPQLIACSRRTKIHNRDYLQGFSRGLQQAINKVLESLK